MKVGRVLLMAAVVCAVTVGATSQETTSGAAKSGQVARGKYLVEQVGMCADCHSPRNAKGEYIKEKWLAGSPLFFKPNFPVPGWVDVAPGIAGLPNWNEKDAIQFLSTGKSMNGRVASPPMPQVRFSQTDAAAVVAYLKSLKSTASTSKPVAPKMSKNASKPIM